MMDTDAMYERFLVEFESFMRARRRRRRLALQPIIWFERLINRALKAFIAVADSFAAAIIR